MLHTQDSRLLDNHLVSSPSVRDFPFVFRLAISILAIDIFSAKQEEPSTEPDIELDSVINRIRCLVLLGTLDSKADLDSMTFDWIFSKADVT